MLLHNWKKLSIQVIFKVKYGFVILDAEFFSLKHIAVDIQGGV